MKSNVFVPYIVSLYLRCTESLSSPFQKENFPKKERTEMVAKANAQTDECICVEDENEEDDQEIISEELNPDQLCSIT
jgi:hypothetical protein